MIKVNVKELLHHFAEYKEKVKLGERIVILEHKKPIIDLMAIKNELSSLSYPLYFLDYETYPSAIPLFNGYKPYQHIPFQFSLHILNEPNGELSHFGYLHQEATDPSQAIITELRKIIGPEGRIIVWHKSFERDRNKELAERNPEHVDFFDDLNDRLYDLEDIFKKQFHVHHGFRGKTSIKKILPV